MNYWIFQGKPSRYDIEKQLVEEKVEEWTAYQRCNKMKVGDIVFFWRAAEYQQPKRGIYGWGKIIKEPTVDEDSGNWVTVKYIRKFPQFIPYEELKTNEKFATHQLFSLAMGTNFMLTEDQYQGLQEVIKNYLGEEYLPEEEV